MMCGSSAFSRSSMKKLTSDLSPMRDRHIAIQRLEGFHKKPGAPAATHIAADFHRRAHDLLVARGKPLAQPLVVTYGRQAMQRGQQEIMLPHGIQPPRQPEHGARGFNVPQPGKPGQGGLHDFLILVRQRDKEIAAERGKLLGREKPERRRAEDLHNGLDDGVAQRSA